MKKSIYLSIITLFIVSASFAQESSKQIFSSPKLIAEVATHKTVAILPFKATISYKRMPKSLDPETRKQEENQLSKSLQSGMYTFLLRKNEDYTVNIQDVERTNALLTQHKMIDNLDLFTADSIAKILGVDAVIKCSYAYEKTGSEGGAIVKSLLLLGSGKVATSELTMAIYNGKEGDLLWRFYKQMNEDVYSSANAVMERMMRKVGRNFPYKKAL